MKDFAILLFLLLFFIVLFLLTAGTMGMWRDAIQGTPIPDVAPPF